MKLSQIVSHCFAPTIIRRGTNYYHTGKVRILQGDAQEVRANVRGGGMYRVMLTREEEFIEASCTCPYADTHGELCKHIWAVILACENKGYLLGDGWHKDLYVGLAGSEDEEYFVEPEPVKRAVRPKSVTTASKPAARKPSVPDWQKTLNSLSNAEQEAYPVPRALDWPASRELHYIIDAGAVAAGIVVELATRQRKKNGEWGKLKNFDVPASLLTQLPDPNDVQILTVLLGAKESYSSPYYYADNDYSYRITKRYQLTPSLQHLLLPQMCATGRCWLRQSPEEQQAPALHWDDQPWEFMVKIEADTTQPCYLVTGWLQRQGAHGQELIPLEAPTLLTESGVMIAGNYLVEVDHRNSYRWIKLLRDKKRIEVPTAQVQDFIETVYKQAQLPPLQLPEALQIEQVQSSPAPYIKIRQDKQRYYGHQRLIGEVAFGYDDKLVSYYEPLPGIYVPEQRRLLLRDRSTEREHVQFLKELGFSEQYVYGSKYPLLELPANKLPQTVRQLIASHWQVEAEGKLYRNPGSFNVSITSGVDWFELHGRVDYDDGQTATLPALLAALKRGENSVKLDDGTYGLLPEEWLKQFGLLAGLGETQKDHVRFRPSQAGFLDALLAAQPEASFDIGFARVREELHSFAGITPGQEPAGFNGELRPYQRDALGWFEFLRHFGFGGCLADDMGLGKTVQILALLEHRRQLRAHGENNKKKNRKTNGAGMPTMPSLAVLPKSLVFNWQREAAKFTPELRVLDHTGGTRERESIEHFADYDLILTTYGTLRNDVVLFKDTQFDYVILDEAQAIKNADTASAKAARLLQGQYKLALSGTPIENHLGELWSLFDFLNPGLLGTASVFSLGASRNPDEDTRKMLSQALRPFILRRTKEQVAKDLPAKLEQTIYCEMEPAQRKRYDELRDHYRHALLSKIEQQGIAKSKIIILEALLRLRQAACHPGLLDKKAGKETGAKLDVLLPQLQEVIDEGHKALVFSQFTSFLSILKTHLDNDKVVYEYLDGKTRNREEKVQRFQNDPNCRLFLISLKAGGLGLNLTAAEYVFLLDPWWNPAVEAQAIDRAHRIGQTRQVFAYRLVTKDTVEEKVLELQNTKRELADAIINADNSLIRGLKREDLELLMS